MRHAAWIAGKGWSMLVSPEDSYLSCLLLLHLEPDGCFTDCWTNEIVSYLLCYSALKEGIETTDPAGGYSSYRETGSSGQGDCAGP